jgi:poly(glycerol-phosphate) alpha-glucosyltransferase
MRQLADDLGLGDTVAFVGPQYGADKAKTYAEADAFILPSHSEGMPMTVLEAWSFGLPVLMTSACHLDVGFERQAAVPVTTDPAALAAAIGAFIARPAAERQAMGASGRRLVAAEYTWQRSSEALAAVYRWLMKEGPRPACVWDD